jgi:predicted AAA+ superfamily ATPase
MKKLGVDFSKYAEALATHPVLLVNLRGNTPKRGASIYLFVDDDDNRMKFEIMKTLIEAKKLKITNNYMILT